MNPEPRPSGRRMSGLRLNRRQQSPANAPDLYIAGVVLTLVDVTERRKATEAMREQLQELERINRAAVGREMRMIELKKEINDLCGKNGEPARYKLVNETVEGTATS